MSKAEEMFKMLQVKKQHPELFSPEIRHLAGEGLKTGTLSEAQIRSLCGSVLEHLKDYDEKNGIFKNLSK